MTSSVRWKGPWLLRYSRIRAASLGPTRGSCMSSVAVAVFRSTDGRDLGAVGPEGGGGGEEEEKKPGFHAVSRKVCPEQRFSRNVYGHRQLTPAP